MEPKQVWHIVWTVLWAISHRRGHCIETKSIVCKFQDDMCGFKQDTNDDFDWSMAHEEPSKSQDHNRNNYICAYRNTTSLRPGSLARLVSPIYQVTTPSRLSLQFRHFKTEGDGSLLRISVESTIRATDSLDKQPFFRPLDELKTELPWSTLEGETRVSAPFQLVIEAEVGNFNGSRVAVDDIILTLHSETSGNGSALTNSPGSQQGGENDTLTSLSGVTSHNAGVQPNNSNEVLPQEMSTDSSDEGVSLCFVLALTSSSLLVIVLVIFVFVVLCLTRKKRRYRRFNFGHDYEEIKSKEAHKQTTSVSAMAIMKERPQPRLVYHNRHTSFSRIQSLSSCLSRLSMRDSLRSSIYAEITDTDLDFDGDLSDPGIGISTTMTTTCTGTWDICSSSSSITGGSDNTVAGGSYATASSMDKMYPNLSDAGSSGSQNDSGWVENIIYERTSDISSFDSSSGPFGIDRALKAIGRNKSTAGFKARQRVHTV